MFLHTGSKSVVRTITRCHSSTRLDSSTAEKIKSIFGPENFTLAESVRQHHAKDESLHQ